MRGSDTWRGIKVSEFELAQLERRGKQLAEEVRRQNQPAAIYGTKKAFQ